MDDSPNAFINQDSKLFISTGLIKYCESYEALVGVLAHEVGHLAKYHILKKKDSIERLKNINNIGNLAVIAGSLVANNSDYLMQSLITNQLGIQNYYQSFNRDQEREADYYAVDTLNKLNLSLDPLIKFLNLLEKKSIQSGIDKEYHKFSTHPIYKERYNIIDNLKSSNKLNITDNEINQKFNYIRAKLFGYTENDKKKLKKYLDPNYALYAESIILSKKGKLKESMQLLNKLISNKKNYFFLLETKADILYSHGFFSQALLFYMKTNRVDNTNYFVRKRIFDINFLLEDINNLEISSNLLSEYSFLLNIFFNNLDLNNKFQILSINSQNTEWINYFSSKKEFNNDKLLKKDFIKILKDITKNTSDINLIKLTNKHIEYLNGN